MKTVTLSSNDGLVRLEVGDEIIAESSQLGVQRATFRLILKGVNDEIPNQVCLPGHTPGKHPWCTHTLGFVGEKTG